MLAPPGPLGRHLGALWPQLATKMSQHIAKMLQKMQSWSQLRLTQCPRCLRHAFQDPPNCKKPIKNLRFFQCFLQSSSCGKIVPECSQKHPQTSQAELKIAILALSWPILASSWLNLALSWPIWRAPCGQLRPSCAHLGPNFGRNCRQIAP